MSDFRELDSRVIRDRIDLAATYEEWLRVRAAAGDVLEGSMSFEPRGDREYLYRRIRRKGNRISKSLGPRTTHTEAILAAFLSQRERTQARLASLSQRIDELAGVMRALGHVRMPSLAAGVLRRLGESAVAPRFRVVGTFALYAYEAMAGVVIEGQHLQTGDMDILVDDRSKLQLIVEGDIKSLEAVVRSVDPGFAQRSKGDFRLTNENGFMVEFIRPEPRPFHRTMPGKNTGVEGDVEPAMISGLQWLVSAPQVETTVIDDRGYPVRMTAPAPAVWAAHKLWVSGRENREPAKALRDRRQADLVRKLIAEHLPQERLDPARHTALPREVAQAYSRDEPPAGRGITPNW